MEKSKRLFDGMRGRINESVLEAMARVPRDKFVPAQLRDRAYEDLPLPIGQGQTISAP
ncbi:MAG: protein-L-isoaspartate O-methyltransferase, partial [Methanosarcinales archaeon]|nr:protein-L-isoaspartate O-methyltransferase [Methanosarcinales archaeon]